MTKTTTNDDNKHKNKFSLDLVKETQKHVSFLQAIHKTGITVSLLQRDNESNNGSVRRYRDLWLPLVAAATENSATTTASGGTSDTDAATSALIPPHDIAWIWHCHRLAPMQYEEYVVGRFHHLLEASPPFVFQRQEQIENGEDDHNENKGKEKPVHVHVHVPDYDEMEQDVVAAMATKTRDLWFSKYPEEPFFLLPDENSTRPTTDPRASECPSSLSMSGYDITKSFQAQSAFLWHVSRPQYFTKEFIRDGVERYYKFLLLNQRSYNNNNNNNNSNNDNNSSGSKKTTVIPVFVPTYQIDLIWHGHILSSCQLYKQDCVAICGQAFYHDDTFGNNGNDGIVDGHRRTIIGGTLNRAFQNTCRWWKDLYNEEYDGVVGSLYAGEPPQDYYTHYQSWTRNHHKTNKAITTATSATATTTVLREEKKDDGDDIDSSSSSNDDDDDDDEDDNHGTDRNMVWKIPSEQDRTFIQPKSGQYNKPMEGYMFGYGVHGLGYYSLTTRDGYEILLKRLAECETTIKMANNKGDNNCSSSLMMPWCCIMMDDNQQQVNHPKDQNRHALSLLYEQQKQVVSCLRTRGPGFFPHETGKKKKKNGSANTQDSSSNNITNFNRFSEKRLCQAAGCGGYVPRRRFVGNGHYMGGYHEGAACGGGGGCGGGVCGGGGCGGGGCGGGGCGGG